MPLGMLRVAYGLMAERETAGPIIARDRPLARAWSCAAPCRHRTWNMLGKLTQTGRRWYRNIAEGMMRHVSRRDR